MFNDSVGMNSNTTTLVIIFGIVSISATQWMVFWLVSVPFAYICGVRCAITTRLCTRVRQVAVPVSSIVILT